MYYYQQQQQSLTPAAAAPAAATQQQHPPQQQPSMYVMDPSQLAALAHQQQQQYFPPQQQQQMFPSPQQQQFNQTFIPQVGGMPNNTAAAIQYIQMLNLQQHLQQQQQAQHLYSNGANGFAAGQQQQQHQFVGSPSPFPTIFQQPTPAVGGKAPPAPQQYQFSAAGAPTNSNSFSTAAYPHGVAPPPPPPMFGFQPQFAAAPHPNPFGATSVVGLTQNNLQFHNTQPSQQLLPTTAAAAAAAPLQRQNSGRAASTSLTRNASSSLLNLSTTPQQQQHQQQPQAASIDDPAPCEHNNWDNLRAKNSVVTLCCRDCQKKWKQQFPIRNLCPEFHMRLVCAFGADCPFLHVHRFKSVQKSPNPPGHIVGAVRNPTFAKLAVEVLAEFPGKEPRDVVDEVRARFSLFSDNSSPPSKSDDGHHADDFGEVFGEIGAVHYPMLPTSFFPLESQRDFWAEPSTGDDASDSRSVQTLDAGASPFRSAASPSPSLPLSRGASTYLTQVLSGGVTGDSPQAASTGNNTPPRNVEGAHLANESVIQPPKFQLLTSH